MKKVLYFVLLVFSCTISAQDESFHFSPSLPNTGLPSVFMDDGIWESLDYTNKQVQVSFLRKEKCRIPYRTWSQKEADSNTSFVYLYTNAPK